MANRYWFQLAQSLLVGRVNIMGSFAPNGASPLVSTNTYGKGFTVAHTSAGVFTITLRDRYAKLLSANATLQLAAAADFDVQIGTYDATAQTLVIRTVVAGVETDVAANANNRINFDLTLSTSVVD